MGFASVSAMLATLYSRPLWEEILVILGPAVLMSAVLVAHVLTDRRWIGVACWGIVAAGVAYYAYFGATDGWKELLPHYPNDSVYDPRWRARFVAALLLDVVILLCLSAPLWRRWVRRRLKNWR